MKEGRNRDNNVRNKIKYTYVKQKINRRLNLKKLEVSVKKLRMSNGNIENVFIPPSHSQGWVTQILTKSSWLPQECGTSWKTGFDWQTVYQGWDGKTSPSASPCHLLSSWPCLLGIILMHPEEQQIALPDAEWFSW